MDFDPVYIAGKYLQPYVLKGDEIVPAYCPFCKGGNNRDKTTFFLNRTSGMYQCFRAQCGEHGTITRLARFFGEEQQQEEKRLYVVPKKKPYKPPSEKLSPLTPIAKAYLNKRKISDETLERCGVFCDKNGNIAFPYKENGELVLLKFRPPRKPFDGEKKGWREAGGKSVFWRMDDVSGDVVIICEGEIDCLSLVECGFNYAVSLPSGAKDLTCLDNCWDWINGFKRIVIWTDNDEPGIECRENLIRRLGAGRCEYVESDKKDANETLYFDGVMAVSKELAKAKKVDMRGIKNLAFVSSQNIHSGPKIKTGINELDKMLGGIRTGELTVVYGSNSSGKSTLCGQLLLEVIEQGYPVCAYSGELRAAQFKRWIDLQAAGPSYVDDYIDRNIGAKFYTVKPEVAAMINDWYDKKFYLYDSDEAGSSGEAKIFEVFKYALQRYGCRVFLIDNLTRVDLSGGNKDYYHSQSRFVSKAKDFARFNDVHVLLVAHTRKTDGGKPVKEDIGGSGNISDLADNVISVWRPRPGTDITEYVKPGGMNPDSIITLEKNREHGICGVIGMGFDQSSKRMYQADMVELLPKQYGWIRNAISDIGVQINIDIPDEFKEKEVVVKQMRMEG